MRTLHARMTPLACSSGDGIHEGDIMAVVALQTESYLEATACLRLLFLGDSKIHVPLS